MNLIDIRNQMLEGKSISEINLRVVFYARVSTEYESQISSLENQIDFFKEYITKRSNWKLIGGYIDEGISGTSTKNRNNFMKMIRDSKRDLFDFIITKNVTRFARNTLDSILYTQELLKNNVGVFFLNDNINTLLPDSDLRLAIMSSIAQDEVRRLSENVRFGLKKSIDKGIILGGNNLYGYKKIDNKLIPDENEKQIVAKMYKLYATGKYNYSTLAKKLKSIGILDRNNKEFNQSTIKRILTNPKYMGYYCGNKTKKIDYKLKKRVINDREKWVTYKNTNKIIPIIEEKEWNRVNKLINIRKKTTFKTNRKLFTNKIMCYEHKSFFTRSMNNIWNCKLYKKGKKYCKSVLIKEYEIKKIITKIIKINFSRIISRYNCIIKKNTSKEIKKLFSNIDLSEFIIRKLVDMIIIKKIMASNSYIMYLFLKYNKKIKINYLL